MYEEQKVIGIVFFSVHGLEIRVVAFGKDDGWSARIDARPFPELSGDAIEDSLRAVRDGTMMTLAIACAFFPTLDPQKYFQ